MSRRSDSDIDFEKYMPSVEAMRQMADPKAAEARLREAFADPELRAMMAAEGRAVEFTPVPPSPGSAQLPAPVAAVEPRPSESVNAHAEPARAASPSVPSPWAKEAPPVVVDASTLPSANVPAASSAGSEKRAARPRHVWTPAAKVIAAIVFAFLPAMLVIVLFVRPEQAGGTRAMTSTTAAAPSVASVEPIASAEPVASAEPAASAAPVVSAVPVAPSTAMKPRARSTAEDPYDAAPAPVPTMSPSTTVPSATASAQPQQTAPVPMFEREP